jgi:hypothetical protein
MKEGAYRPQPKQPEHMQPLQGTAEGQQSLQGPTTVEDSEQRQPQQESAAGKLRTYLQESLGVNQPEGEVYDVNIFTTRVIDGLQDRIDSWTLGNKTGDMIRKERQRRAESRGQTLDASVIQRMEIEKTKDESYLKGLIHAMKIMGIHIRVKDKVKRREILNNDVFTW